LDDFQDRSPLRRGRPSTHTVFGPAQAINSSSYAIVEAISKIQNMSGMDCAKSATKKIVTIFKGQAMDLHWTYNSECPSVEQYMQMISDSKEQIDLPLCSRTRKLTQVNE
jgi:geranylgeranyl pyrophosphate synthase